MKKALRYMLGGLALLLAALLTAPFFIDVNDYKDEISQRVEDATGRAVTIGGIQVSLFPWVGVELEDVHLANPDGFAARDFISIRHLDVKVAVLPLLDGRYEIKEFLLDAPNVYLQRRADARTNWDDLLTSSAEEPPTRSRATGAQDAATAPPSVLAGLKADHITINDGKITWNDELNHVQYAFDALHVALDDVQLERPINVQLSGTLQGDRFELSGMIGPIGDTSALRVERLPIKLKAVIEKLHLKSFATQLDGWPGVLGAPAQATLDLRASLEQRPDGGRMIEGELALDAAHAVQAQWRMDSQDAQTLHIGEATLRVDQQGVLSLSGKLKGFMRGQPTFDLMFKSEPLTRTWLATFVPALQDMYAHHPAPWRQVQARGLVAGDAKHVEFRDLQLLFDEDRLHGVGQLRLDKPDIRLQLTGAALHLDPWLPQADSAGKEQGGSTGAEQTPEAGATSSPPSETASEPDLRFLKDWSLNLRLEIDALHLRGLQLNQFRTRMHGKNGRIALNPMRFGLAGGRVEEQATLNVAEYPARWTESAHVMGVRVGPVLQALNVTDKLEGTLALETTLKGVGLTERALGSLNGKGNVMLRDGMIRGFDIAGTMRRVLHPGSPDTGPQQTDFTQLSGTFTIRHGVLSNKDLFMASPLLRVSGAGTVDLANRTLDYRFKPTVVGTLRGQGDQVTIRKGLTIPLRVTGGFDAPKVRPEVDARTVIQGIRGGAVGGALGGLLGGGQGKPPAKKQRKRSGKSAPNPLQAIPLPF